MAMRRGLVAVSLVAMGAAGGVVASAQGGQDRGPAAAHAMPGTTAVTPVPAAFVIGPEDVLSIVFWRDKDMSAKVTVRPDGKISLPLLDEVQAAGLTPAELRATLLEQARRFVANPTVTVVVDQINSRKVFITGQVVKPGAYVIAAPTTVLQLISMAGGLKDFADSRQIVVYRHENGRPSSHVFDYRAVRRHPGQNIELKPGDTVVVP